MRAPMTRPITAITLPYQFLSFVFCRMQSTKYNHHTSIIQMAYRTDNCVIALYNDSTSRILHQSGKEIVADFFGGKTDYCMYSP